jgi:multidrug efflux pump subunit AcrB
MIDRRRIIVFLTVIIAIAGVICYYHLPRQESPDVSAPIAMVITPYPGASAEDVDQLVTKKIEDELSELDGYDYSMTVSKDSVSIVGVIFHSNVDTDQSMQNVRNAVADIRSELPAGCFQSIINTDLVETAGIIISLSGENYSYEQLASFGEQFKEKLIDIEGVSRFCINGDLEKEVEVKIDVARLNQLGVSLEDVYTLLRAQNIEIPSGDIECGQQKIKVKTFGNYSSLQDIRNTIVAVSRETGVVTRLGDIADIKMIVEDDVEKFKQDGKNAVLLTGYFEDSKNVVIIGKDVRLAIDELKAQLPEDLVIQEVVYQPQDVSDSTNEFMNNLLVGVLFVIVVVCLGMGLRNAIVVSTAVPLSILITFTVMYFSGIKIHQISLTALIIALGILVDNAIVVSDMIQVRMNDGEDRISAVRNGTKMSAVPIFTATLTTIAAFSPLLGIHGVVGEFVKTVPLVLIISVIASYVVAMFVMPSMAAIFFKVEKQDKRKEGIVRAFFRNTLKMALKAKVLTIATVFIVLVLVVKFILPLLSSQFFPYVDKNLVYIDMFCEKSGDINATEKLTDEVTQLLSKQPEITSTTVAIGDGMPKFYITMLPAMPSKDYAQMVCKFDLGKKGEMRFKNRKQFADYLQELLDKNIPNGDCQVKLLEYAKPLPKVCVKIGGQDLDRLEEIANKLEHEVKKIEGTSNIRTDMADDTFQFEVHVDEDKASSLGVTKYDIQRQINIGLYGATATVFRKDGKEYNIKIKSDMKSIKDLENLEIKSSITGKKVPLKQIANVGFGPKKDCVKRYKCKKTVAVEGGVLEGYDASLVEDKIENEILPKIDTFGAKITFDGEREMIKEYFTIVAILAIIAIFIIYIILVIQFNSFIQPLVILMTIPLSIIGSTIGLFVLDKPLSFMAFLGVVALIGLVVKNGILLIEYINDSRKRGYTIDEACIDAVEKRFNAIILSAATTVMGLVPLAFSGSELFSPMAVSLMAGLIVSTFLTMVIIPVIYSLIETFIEKRKIIKQRSKTINE